MGLSIHGTIESDTGDAALDASSFMELDIHGTTESDTGDAPLDATASIFTMDGRKPGLPTDGQTAAAVPTPTTTPPR
jgi:hypothetical protein